MNNGIVTVTAEGVSVMGFERDFCRWADRNGIRDPFQVSMKLFKKRCHNRGDGAFSVDIEFDEVTGKIKEPEGEPSRAEKDKWIIMRDEYIARRCFEEIGYDSFVFRTEKRGSEYDIDYMRDLDEFVPCKSADRQCRMSCKYFGTKDCV